MPILTLSRFISAMEKNIKTINYMLDGVSQETAASTFDGDWNVIAVLCHLSDFDEIFLSRARLMNERNFPVLTPVDHEELATKNRYNEQMLEDVLARFTQHRATFTAWLKTLSEERWHRGGEHPENGEMSILEQAVQVCTHDADHIEQMARMLCQRD